MMGCSPGDAECFAIESPVHQVTLTNAFYIGKTEVTQAQWQATMGSNPSYFGGQPNNPVEQVSWNMIQGFNTATSLRLPTEAEWEFACRAGTMTARYGVFDDIAWHDTNSGGATHAVATKLPNALGLYDTIGNDLEWCQDWYGPYASGGVTNPTGPTLELSVCCAAVIGTTTLSSAVRQNVTTTRRGSPARTNTDSASRVIRN